MPANRSNAAALLQKVNSQLRGERVPLKTKEEDELATYLSSLTQKTQQARSLNYEDQGDISVSSGADGLRGSHSSQGGRRAPSPQGLAKVSAAGSKFLKKKKPDLEEDNSDEERKELLKGNRGGIVIAGSGPDENSSKRFKKGAILDKKVKNRALRHHASVDSESEDSLRGSEPVMRPSSADISISRDGPKFLKNRKSLEEDKAEEKANGSHLVQRSSSIEKKKKSEGNKTKGEIVRTLGHVYLTSEEESLAEFIHGLSVSESSAKRPQNLVAKKQQKWRKKSPGAQQKVVRSSPSPVHQRSRSPSPFKRTPSPFGKLSRSQSQDSDMMLDSMASEIMEDRHHNHHQSGQASFSSEDHFNINLMDVASLLPSSPRQKGKKKKEKHQSKSMSEKQKTFPSFSAKGNSAVSFKARPQRDKSARKKHEGSNLKRVSSESNLFESLGIHMVDELTGPDNRNSGESDSEIKTEPLDERQKSMDVKHSESEIITEIGGGRFKSAAPFKAVVAQSVSELIGSGAHIPRRTLESETDDTEVDNVYSESFASDSESKTIEHSVSQRYQEKASNHKERRRSHSPEFDNETSHRASRQLRRKDHTLVVEEKRLNVSARDPSGGLHHWNTSNMDIHISQPLGLQYVDPAPVATHVVSADALEAITAYSPNVLALQDMMRAQLDLVKNFVDIHNRIYQSCLDGLQYDHQYTTLEDTKAYIEQHRKPRMTFKEALRLVEQEENIARH
ncbi:hypothetical protein PoB_000557400 [Plakobranchus ocellatus]|uniref:DUF4614 domain-containing protein n=1 Tax=Plakobranchus ocellatus TaxID=259542 RepID=A0AAV3Y9X2_9GAST|nr:hypothetical protein PoB_000557400 [Plakobranchus ocellatus]